MRKLCKYSIMLNTSLEKGLISSGNSYFKTDVKPTAEKKQPGENGKATCPNDFLLELVLSSSGKGAYRTLRK